MKDEELAIEKDKLGDDLIVKLSPTLAFSPAYLLFLKQQVQLLENGHGTNFTTWEDKNCGVIYTESVEKINGFIVYDHSEAESKGMLSIVLTAVDNDARGRGIYSIMHKWFEEIARRKGCSLIRATVSPKNTHRLKTCEAVGLKIGFHLLYKQV